MKKGLLLLVCVFYFIGMGFSQNKAKIDTITTKSGLKYFKVKKGTGAKVEKNKINITHVILSDLKGKELWSTRKKDPGTGELKTFDFVYGQMSLIKGFNEGVGLMRIGDRFTFILHPAIAYGERGAGNDIPPNTTLVFDIEIIKVE